MGSARFSGANPAHCQRKVAETKVATHGHYAGKNKTRKVAVAAAPRLFEGGDPPFHSSGVSHLAVNPESALGATILTPANRFKSLQMVCE